MALGNNPFGANSRRMTHAQAYDAGIDAGLRSYMLGVYNYMAAGVAITGLVAYLVGSNPAIYQQIMGSGLMWLVVLAPIGLVFAISFGINRMQASTAQMLFWVYAALMGVSLSTIFVAYTGQSVARVFFISAGSFAALSLYGYTTKKDLTGFGSFLFMGLIGILLASVVNIFLASSALHFTISVLGVLIFAGLTAYDTQRIKSIYYEGDDSEVMAKKSVMGALTLYLDFINLFIMLMQLLGDRR